MGDRLVRWGLPRAANAVPLLMEFIVVTVATVLAIRFALFLTGYPQLGGNGLHIAHVLWGGLLMAVGVMALLSFSGRTIRPVAAFAAGIGFGLFIDEVGKFLTSDNDYFFTPSIAIMYVVLVLLVLAIHAIHGRRPLSPRELYVAALESAASGVTTGMTEPSRELALRRIAAAGDAPGARQAAGLVRSLPAGDGDRYDVTRLGWAVTNRLRRVLRTRGAMRTTVVVLLVQTGVTLLLSGLIVVAVIAREAGADITLRVTDPVPTAIGGVSSVVSAVCVLVGVHRLRHDRRVSGFRWLERAVLVDVLLTRVFEFAVYQFAAIPLLILDLLLLGALEFAIRNAVDKDAAVGDAQAEEAEYRADRSREATAYPVAVPVSSPASRPDGGTPVAVGDAPRAAADDATAPPDVRPAGSPVATDPAAARRAASGAGPPHGSDPSAARAPAADPAPSSPASTSPVSTSPVSTSPVPAGPAPGSRESASPASGSQTSASPASAGPATRGPVPAGAGQAADSAGWSPSHAGVVGGAMAAGCGAVAGGLVAGVSTRPAAAKGAWAVDGEGLPDRPRPDGDALGRPAGATTAREGDRRPDPGQAPRGDDADEIVDEVLDDSRPGDHDRPVGGLTPAAPPFPAPADTTSRADSAPADPAPVGGSAPDDGAGGEGAAGAASGSAREDDAAGSGDGPGRTAADDAPPKAAWIGSRARNAGSARYEGGSGNDARGRAGGGRGAARTPGSTVEHVTPPPLS